MMMKRIFFVLAFVSAIVIPAQADNDKPINFEELPQEARTFINENFHGVNVSFTKQERELLSVKYEVLMADGTNIQFDSGGKWNEIECKYGEVPGKFLPEPVKDYMSANYPGEKCVKIERSSRDYEIELSNGYELTFDLSFRLIGMDR